MSTRSSPGGWHRFMAVLALTTLFLLSANICQAQNPVDPANSYVEILGDVNLLTVGNGAGDPLGDLGIIVHCYDDLGDPIAAIPGSAFSIVNLSGTMVEFGTAVLAADTTDTQGRILLTEPLRASATIVHGSVAVAVDIGGEEVVIDNGGAGIPVEFRSPDLNHDGIINLTDLVVFASAYDCCDDTEECLQCDFDGDGCVSIADMVMFADHMGGGAMAVARRAAMTAKVIRDDVFVGCVQRDFDDDDDPATIREEVVLAPGGLVFLKLLVKDFACMSGVDFTFVLPSGLVEVGGSMTAIAPFENLQRPIPPPGGTRATLTAPYITSGPTFMCQVLLQSPTGGTFNITDIHFVDVVLTDCMYPPTETVGCVGTPTPCDMSYIVQDSDQYITCPGDDLSQPDNVTVVMRDQDGNGISGLRAADFKVYLTDDLGGNRADTFKLTPQFPFTDVNGELDFRFEPRGTCRWPDACLDLNIRIVYEGCSMEINKMVQTLNIVRYEQGDGPTDLIDDDDIAAWTAALYTGDICLYLVRGFRTPVVTHAALNIVNAHYLHGCGVSDVPALPVEGAVLLHQNTPNPFNPATEIQLTLPADAEQAELTIYDLKGRVIRRLWQGPLPEGMSRFTWNGRDAGNRSVGSGVYLVQLQALGEKTSMRMLLLK